MPEILLTAVNARYNHTNIAVRSIALYCSKIADRETIDFSEWTINQNISDILRGIFEQNPKVLLFSTYIWNSEIVQKLISEIKKLLPDCIIGCGGPEAGFNPIGYLQKNANLAFVISGEGEESVRQITELYQKKGNLDTFSKEFKQIKGIWSRNKKETSVPVCDSSNSAKPGRNLENNSCQKSTDFFFSGERELLCDLSLLPFPYPEIDQPDNKIYYYESSRGCPFSCSYCMSSLDKRVRFMPLGRVFTDLQKFLDAKTRLVKFVDRTYNLNEERYIKIWEYILTHHNGITMFHFEIEAQYLSQKALDFLQKVPQGIMQFEIGVQSANPKSLKAVNRSPDTKILKENILQIPKTIHTHLDLIAGLPYEDLKSFGNSFNFVLSMQPDALQLGFLKVLHGTQMEEYSQANGWKWQENPPYETLLTPYLSYSDILFLKDIEKLTDIYWNSHLFDCTMNYINSRMDYWTFFCQLLSLVRSQKALENEHKIEFWFEFLAENASKALFSDQSSLFIDLLRYDFIKKRKVNSFPAWFNRKYNAEGHTEALKKVFPSKNIKALYSISDFQDFSTDPRAFDPRPSSDIFQVKNSKKQTISLLFIYSSSAYGAFQKK
ncbi:MAG: B12-binding domain-containing radical SAM protein [Treponema sp.]|nr:B12-binding domain-containing radical SAM protein [Treponema sp.]